MNIYIYVEIASRELDSKLLLATLAASRGHHVLVSDLSSIIEGVKAKVLSPGIFHDKSLTPTKNKISVHKLMKNNGSIITSIDEENNLINHGYEKFAKNRFSDLTLNDAEAVFGWGLEDYKTLEEIYSEYAHKFHMTGSPRIDLLKSKFSRYWQDSKIKFKKPFLLVASNFQANNMKSFHDTLNHLKDVGYFENDPAMFKKKFDEMAESYKRMYSFIEAVKFLSTNNNNYEIIFRPHPAENIEAWKVFLKGIPNLHVIREGSIAEWINKSFALLHNGCTSAIEATILGKQVITYMPFKLEHYTCEVPNSLGIQVKTLEELSINIKNSYNNFLENKSYKKNENNLRLISKKIFLDEKELASEKIIKIWEKLYKKELNVQTNWNKYKNFLFIKKNKKKISKILKKFQSKNSYLTKSNYKFPILNEKEIKKKVKKLNEILEIDKKIDCKLIGERTIIIK